MQLPSFDWGQGKEHLVKIVLTSPEATQFQIYFQKRQKLHYQDENSVVTNLVEGRNEIYLSLGDVRFRGRLRLDPGMVAGEYVLHELEVRAN